MDLPPSLTHDMQIRRVTPVSGGSIASAYRLDTDDGPLFLKTTQAATPDLFEREAAGLEALRRHAPPEIGIPQVLKVDPEGLVLEWIEVGGRNETSEAALGRGLAALHRATHPTFGAIDDALAGYLGSAEVDLTPSSTWPEFLVERRVRPLTQRAVREGNLAPEALSLLDGLAEQADTLCGPAEPPALLHGDLWAGNRVVDIDGRNWLLDPACHWGHREYDLAMMQLFGGFGSRCFSAYDDAFPLADGWQDRVEWNQLPPLLVHAILFGGGYGARALDIMRRHAR